MCDTTLIAPANTNNLIRELVKELAGELKKVKREFEKRVNLNNEKRKSISRNVITFLSEKGFLSSEILKAEYSNLRRDKVLLSICNNDDKLAGRVLKLLSELLQKLERTKFSLYNEPSPVKGSLTASFVSDSSSSNLELKSIFLDNDKHLLQKSDNSSNSETNELNRFKSSQLLEKDSEVMVRLIMLGGESMSLKNYVEWLRVVIPIQTSVQSSSDSELVNTEEQKNMSITSIDTVPETSNSSTYSSTTSSPIGRVIISSATPSTPTHFYFWIKHDEGIEVEAGSIITAKGRTANSEELKVTAIVEEIKAISEIPNTITEFYSYNYGDPQEDLRTEIPIIREAKARLIYRSDGKLVPIVRKLPIFFAEREDIEEAYSKKINSKDRLLLGFTFDNHRKPVPIFGDYNYIFGYKGAHINISGTSGLAAKTSYAIFLIISALSLARTKDLDIGVIAFNVKEKDLLRLRELSNYENLEDALKELRDYYKNHDPLWRECKKCGVDPFDLGLRDGENLKILEPGEHYKFGLRDIIELGDNTPDILRLFFDPEDINDNFEALLSGITYEVLEGEFKGVGFKGLKEKLLRFTSSNGRRQGRGRGNSASTYFNVGNIPIHGTTIGKFVRRLEVAMNQMRRVLTLDVPRAESGYRLPVNQLRKGNLMIIDIEPLTDRGKRVIFLSVLKLVNRILEAKREGLKELEVWGDKVDISKFPSRVVIFIDELNKFAPKGKHYSPIKYPIIDIASRGRSIGLSLISAQQLASQVDEEVLANTSTLVIGRSHPVEIKDRAYGWLKGDLLERTLWLNQGELILFHALHSAPVLINFPVPIHLIREL